MGKEGRFDRIGIWEGTEGRAIQIFGYLFVVFIIVVVANSLFLVGFAERSFWVFILGLATDLLVAFALSSLVMGVYYVYHFRKEGIVPIKDVMKTVIQVGLILGLFFTIMVAVEVHRRWTEAKEQANTVPEDESSSDEQDSE